MNKDELITLARLTAQNFGLDPALVCAVVEQESGWNPDATRFEPAFKKHYIDPLAISEPEATNRATSWGLCQVMGQTAREHGYIEDLPTLLDPQCGLTIGCTVLKSKLKQAGGDVHQALLYWNGGANKAYPDEVLARKAKYQPPVTDIDLAT